MLYNNLNQMDSLNFSYKTMVFNCTIYHGAIYFVTPKPHNITRKALFVKKI